MIRDRKEIAIEVGSIVTMSATVERIAPNGEYAVQIYGDVGGAIRLPGSALRLAERPKELRDILKRPVEDDALFKLLKAGKATAADQDFAAEWLKRLQSQLIEAMTPQSQQAPVSR